MVAMWKNAALAGGSLLVALATTSRAQEADEPTAPVSPITCCLSAELGCYDVTNLDECDELMIAMLPSPVRQASERVTDPSNSAVGATSAAPPMCGTMSPLVLDEASFVVRVDACEPFVSSLGRYPAFLCEVREVADCDDQSEPYELLWPQLSFVQGPENPMYRDPLVTRYFRVRLGKRLEVTAAEILGEETCAH
jgi:hypothetical protein